MTDENLKLLDEEIKRQIEAISALGAGSKEHENAVETLVKLQRVDADIYKMRVDFDARDADRKTNEANREQDAEFKKEELALRTRELALKCKQIEVDEKKNEADSELESQRQKTDKTMGVARIVAEFMGIGLPVITYVLLFYQGLNFEKEGVIGSNMVRNLMGKFKLTKK